MRTALFSLALLMGTVGSDGASNGCESPQPEVQTLLMDDGGMSDGGGMRPDGAAVPDGGTPAASGKVPHLINLTTGEDLGILVDVDMLVVYSEKASALIALGKLVPSGNGQLLFPEPDCKGTPVIAKNEQYYVPAPKLANMAWLLGPSGTYLMPVGPTLFDPVVKSTRKAKTLGVDGMTICENVAVYIYRDRVTEVVDTGILRRPPDEKLKVELR